MKKWMQAFALVCLGALLGQLSPAQAQDGLSRITRGVERIAGALERIERKCQ